MNIEEILKSIKGLVTPNEVEVEAAVIPEATTAPVAAMEPVSVPLKDGSIMMVDKMEVGGVATIDGAPAMPGDYETADGNTISIAEGGMIAAVGPVAAEPMAQDYSENFAQIDAKFADYETKFAAYEEKFAGYETKISNQESAIQQLVGVVEQLAKIPAADPLEAPKTFSKAESRKEQIERLAEAAKKYKSYKN